MATTKHIKLPVLLFLLVALPHFYFSNIDSLLTVVKTQKDTTRINTLVRIANNYINAGQMADGEKYLIMAHDENTLVKDLNCELFISIKNISFNYKKSKFKLAYELGEETLPLAIQLKKSDAIAECKMYMGMCAGRLGDFKKALAFYHQALPVFEANHNLGMQMKLYSNIAGVYFDQLDYKTAIEYFKKTLEMAIQKSDNKVIGQTYNNIGSALSNLNDKGAKEYYLKAVKVNLLSDNKHNLGYNYMNLASCEIIENNIVKAKEYNKEALAIFTEFKDPYSIVSCLSVDADIFISEKKYKQAVEVMERAIKICDKTGSPLLMERTYKQMADCYELAGDLKRSISYMRKFVSIKDSIINDEIREEVTKKQLYYEFDKKRLADSLDAEAKQKYLKQEVDNNKRSASLQRNISVISLLSLLIVGILAFYIYRGLKKNKQASKIIEDQKRIVEGKNTEILDSISYAKRIQNAILPSSRLVKEYFKDSFILYKPKDIVAGDFYWMEVISQKQSLSSMQLSQTEKVPTADLVLIAAADCTGHGVPGALVSVVCHNALNRSVREYGITDPGKILDKTRDLVISEFEKSEEEVLDGMDISLCVLDIKTMEINWSGANNPLWIIRNNELMDVKPDKQPIGKFESAKPFTSHKIKLEQNDCIYIFTDGYQDQFGGESAKKFKVSKFKELILSVSASNMEEQQKRIDNAFHDWKGELEQVDDICIIGIRI
ncbi:MAG: tetratricopeptide repeat protein [Bacteroidetes bacterium]|nr:tetratricopeptide repeat protein [Bacteroidota bacterium]